MINIRMGLLGGALLAASFGASAAPIDAPRAVARAVLAGYTKAGKSDTGTFGACPQYCDPAFAKIIDRVDKLGGDDGPGPFDADIFCGCQDYDHQTFFLVSDKLKTATRYEAIVNGSDKGSKPWTFVLIPVAGGWKIADVIDEYGPIRPRMLNALKPENRGK
jgi:hypothetical protein